MIKKIMRALFILLSTSLLSTPYKANQRTSSSNRSYKGSSPITKASSSKTPRYIPFLSSPENQRLLLEKRAQIMKKSYDTSLLPKNETPQLPVPQKNFVFSSTIAITDKSKLPTPAIQQPSHLFIPRAEESWVFIPEQKNVGTTIPQKPLTQNAVQQPIKQHIIQPTKNVPKNKTTQKIKSNQKKETVTDDEAPVVAESISSYLTKNANTKIFDILKTKMKLSTQLILSQTSSTDIIVKELGNLMIKLQGLSKNPKAHRTLSLDGLKRQIQYLAEQIKLYNNETIYTNPNQIVLFIEFMNRFIKENTAISISQAMSEKLQNINKVAQATCSIFQNKNIILSIFNAPASVILEFENVIQKTHNLQNMSFTKDLVQTIYNKNGTIDQIFNAWKKFQTSATYKDNPINRQYGAFVTFLLLFETTMVATATILAMTSERYQVTNPIPIIINITK